VFLEPYGVLAVIALVLLCTMVLQTLVFQPVLRVMEQRARAVTEARELAESSAQKARAAASDYDRTLTGARSDVYRQMDEKRRAALEHRAALVAATRADVEREIAEARLRVIEQSTEARAQIDRDAVELAAAIERRVLGRAS
jgi:F-type H+-transporting ATPase subunit b